MPAPTAFPTDFANTPFLVIWECTRACPLACLHCRADAQTERQPGELSVDEAADLAGQVASFGNPPPLFVITGGDPFARDDLLDIVRAAKERGLSVAVSPSGTPALNEANLAGLKEAGVTAISLSIDGSTAARHDRFRGVPGVYGCTLRAWDTARELGLKVQINTTISRHNLRDLPAIVRLVAARGAMTWSAFFLVPTGRGRQLESLDPTTVEDVLNFVYDAGEFIATKTTEAPHFRRVSLQRTLLESAGIDPVTALGLGTLYRDIALDLKTTMADFTSRTRRPPLAVNAGYGFVFVSHVGDVHPSGFLPIAAGNIRDRSLVEIYREAEIFTGLRDARKLHGRCGRCEFTMCGGSRSRAYALTGDPYGEEPWCSYEPGTFPFQAELAEMMGTT